MINQYTILFSMPELPEVETVKIGLLSLVVGKTIKSVETDWIKSLQCSQQDLNSFVIGSKIIDVRRRAKVLILDLSSGYSLIIHLKMTGQLIFVGLERFGAGHPNDSLVDKLPNRSTRVNFVFSDNSNLYFNDQRKFGWIKLVATHDLDNHDFLSKLGPEPLSDEFTYEVFIDRLQRRKSSNIKSVLLDQTILAGIGNIYADESLWSAEIHPSQLVKNIRQPKLKKLHSEIIFILKLSIEKGGSTDKNYVNAEGKRGSYLEFANVFRRESQPCPRCGNVLVKIRVAGRGTHVCPNCQKI